MFSWKFLIDELYSCHSKQVRFHTNLCSKFLEQGQNVLKLKLIERLATNIFVTELTQLPVTNLNSNQNLWCILVPGVISTGTLPVFFSGWGFWSLHPRICCLGDVVVAVHRVTFLGVRFGRGREFVLRFILHTSTWHLRFLGIRSFSCTIFVLLSLLVFARL